MRQNYISLVCILNIPHIGPALTSITRRLSAGEHTNPIPLLRDIDQPFVFEIKFSEKAFRLEFYDTSSLESWRLLDPDVVIICYDISQRLSLINMKRYVSLMPSPPFPRGPRLTMSSG